MKLTIGLLAGSHAVEGQWQQHVFWVLEEITGKELTPLGGPLRSCSCGPWKDRMEGPWALEACSVTTDSITSRDLGLEYIRILVCHLKGMC